MTQDKSRSRKAVVNGYTPFTHSCWANKAPTMPGLMSASAESPQFPLPAMNGKIPVSESRSHTECGLCLANSDKLLRQFDSKSTGGNGSRTHFSTSRKHVFDTWCPSVCKQVVPFRRRTSSRRVMLVTFSTVSLFRFEAPREACRIN